MRRKKKNHHEEEMSEAWLLPYSDLMTLLLAVFIVLFAVSKQDEVKAAAMAEAFRSIFTGEVSVMEQVSDGVLDGGAETEPMPNLIQPITTEDLIQNLQQRFEAYINENNLNEQMKASYNEDGVLIILTSDVWFPSGSAEINVSQDAIAREVAVMIAENQGEDHRLKVVVSGHTDNMPISTAQYASNWSLSVDRAVNFMEMLINYSGLNPAQFSARGLGEYDPLATNDTEEGRQRNRRVEVYISPL